MKDREKKIKKRNNQNCGLNKKSCVGYKNGCCVSIENCLGKEMIEEIANDMGYACTKHDLWPEDAKETAKALTILGYRKVGADEVVISKKEYERLHSIEIAFKEFANPNGILIPVEEYEVLKIKAKEKHWLQTCMSVWENAKIDGSKETAEKILKWIIETFGDLWYKIDEVYDICDYISKKFDIDIKEN